MFNVRPTVLVLAALVAGLLILVMPLTASGSGHVHLCSEDAGSYLRGEKVTLPFTWTHQSVWKSTRDYHAHRVRPNWTSAYHHFQDVSVYGQVWSFTNTVNVERSTQMINAGLDWAWWQMWQYALTSYPGDVPC